MFVLCPHCEFLVGVDPRTGKAPATCPKCGKALEAAQAEGASAPVDEVAIPQGPSPASATPDTAAAAAAPPPAAEPPVARPSADDLIAAISAKAPKKPRAKPRPETEPAPKPAPRESTRRKRAEPDTPADATPDTTPATAPAPGRAPPKPSLARRLAAWWRSRTKVGETSSTALGETQATRDAARHAATRRKASVRPIPSLRDRAAARAAAAEEAAIATAGVSEIEALSIGEMPEVPTVDVRAVATPAVDSPVVDSPIVEPPVVEPPVVESPVVESPVVEPPVVEPPVVDSPVESPVVESPAVESPAVEAPPESPAPASRIIEPASAAPPTIEAAAPIPSVAARPRTAPAPSFLRTASPSGAFPTGWPRIAAIGGLALLLALQLLLAQRDALASDARWRPTINALCAALRCTVPAWRQPGAFTMLSRDVRPHARAPGTLQIDASFRNDARWPQPWPRLVVSLSDIDGRVLGTRAFTANEYLGANPTQNTLASGQAAAVHLAVVEPAPGIVAFSFEFR